MLRFKNELAKCNNYEHKYWLDEDAMNGDIVQKMCDGIDQSEFVIFFITKSYIEKVAGRGPKGDQDNCYLEFNYAARQKGANNLIAVVMEEECLDTSQWYGPVGGHLGGQLYYSFTKTSELSQCVGEISKDIERKLKDNDKNLTHTSTNTRRSMNMRKKQVISARNDEEEKYGMRFKHYRLLRLLPQSFFSIVSLNSIIRLQRYPCAIERLHI